MASQTHPKAERQNLYGHWTNLRICLLNIVRVVVVWLRQLNDQLKLDFHGWKSTSYHWPTTKGRVPKTYVGGQWYGELTMRMATCVGLALVTVLELKSHQNGKWELTKVTTKLVQTISWNLTTRSFYNVAYFHPYLENQFQMPFLLKPKCLSTPCVVNLQDKIIVLIE